MTGHTMQMSMDHRGSIDGVPPEGVRPGALPDGYGRGTVPIMSSVVSSFVSSVESSFVSSVVTSFVGSFVNSLGVFCFVYEMRFSRLRAGGMRM